MKLPQETALYLFINNRIQPSTTMMMSAVYDEYKDEDGFLYITYSGENTFG